MFNNHFKKPWEALESLYPRPTRCRMLRYQSYHRFKELILKPDPEFVWGTLVSLYMGDVYLLTDAFDPQWMKEIKDKTMSYFRSRPSEFYRMFEGCPDFHRAIDIETSKKYSFNVCKHSATIYHGVAPCDRNVEPDWNSPAGRWFLSMYSNDSDEVKYRHTGHPVKLELPGILP